MIRSRYTVDGILTPFRQRSEDILPVFMASRQKCKAISASFRVDKDRQGWQEGLQRCAPNAKTDELRLILLSSLSPLPSTHTIAVSLLSTSATYSLFCGPTGLSFCHCASFCIHRRDGPMCLSTSRVIRKKPLG